MYFILLQIEWKGLLLGSESWSFLLETAFRSIVMFLVILFSLRLLGKRGIKQLSVFELGVIIGLGSAAGDPMFYKDVGLLPGMVVFLIVLLLYKFVTYLINRSEKFEQFIEGEPTYIVKNGQLVTKNVEEEPIARDELFMQMRLNKVTHLGQVEHAILENNGELSLAFYAAEDVRYGLPILPHLCDHKVPAITETDHYACLFCGYTDKLHPGTIQCIICDNKEWVKAINVRRIG